MFEINLVAILAMYRSPMFLKFPVAAQLVNVAAFLFWAAPFTWIAWKNPPSLQKYLVQNKTIDVKKWFWPSIGRLFANNAILLILILPTWPLLMKSGIHDGQWEPWYIILLQLLFFIFLDDFLYYFMHRLGHTRAGYKYIHSVHHRVITPCAIAGNYFHPIEFIFTTMLVLLGPLLVSCHIYTLYIWIIFRQLQAADGHSGYEFPWNPLNYFPFYHGTAYHDFLHSKFLGNHAGFRGYMDRFFGGYAKGYVEYRQRQKSMGQ